MLKAARLLRNLRTWRVLSSMDPAVKSPLSEPNTKGAAASRFVPAAGEPYSLRLTEPAGIKTSFALPAVKNSGVVITSVGDISAR